MKNANKQIAEREASRRRHTGAAVVLVTIGTLAFIGLVFAFFASLANDVRAQQAGMRADTPSEGIGRVYAEDVPRYAAGDTAAKTGTALRVFCETDPDLPAWWNPEDAEIVYQANTRTTHSDALDYNLNTTLWGWDGHGMEKWEADLFARIVYLEFNGTDPECLNAGIDSILNLWDSGYFGRTIFETLSATAENGALVYTTYGYVWAWDYDYTVLEEIKTICMDRFVNGPQYGCHFFQLYKFPRWAQPLYEIDHVYFSTFKEGTR